MRDKQKTNLSTIIINRMGERLSLIIGKEPACISVLRAAKARREFLNILYDVNKTETKTGIKIYNVHKNHAMIFENRFLNWLSIVEGTCAGETQDTVNEALIDYQVNF